MPLNAKLRSLDNEITNLNLTTRDLKNIMQTLEGRVVCLEGGKKPPLHQGKVDGSDVNLPSSDEEEDPEKMKITADHIKVKLRIFLNLIFDANFNVF